MRTYTTSEVLDLMELCLLAGYCLGVLMASAASCFFLVRRSK